MAQLNAIGVGDLGAIADKLLAAGDDLGALGIDDIRAVVEDARTQLAGGEVSEFRRLVSQAVSRLGHVR